MRRMRANAFSRDLMSENTLTAADLIYPIFVLEGSGQSEAVSSMPGVERRSIDLTLDHLRPLVNKGLRLVALFPVISAQLKSLNA